MILQRSLTLRLSCFFSIATMLIVFLLCVFISYSVEEHFIKDDKIVLLKKTNAIQEKISSTSFNGDFSTVLNNFERHDGFIIEVKQAGTTVYASNKVSIPDTFFSNTNFNPGTVFNWNIDKNPYSGMRLTFAAKESLDAPFTIVLARNIKSDVRFLKNIRSILFDFIILAGVITAILSWFLTKRGLQPLQALCKQATQISVNDIDQRMPVENLPNEIAGLSITLNKMLERLEDAFRQLSNFSSDIAHELRTPINNLMMQNQVSLSQPRTEQEYRGILASNAEEYEHLARMISDMLYLAKVENQLALHSTETIPLNKELVNLAEFYDALAEDNQITFKIEGEATVEGDKLMLNRAFSNLISNAVRHGYENSVITISMMTIKNDVFIAFKNKGETIAPEDLQHIFKRFYRADKSRTNSEEEHVGLGLAITQSIAKAHGGDLQVSSYDEETVFTLKVHKGF